MRHVILALSMVVHRCFVPHVCAYLQTFHTPEPALALAKLPNIVYNSAMKHLLLAIAPYGILSVRHTSGARLTKPLNHHRKQTRVRRTPPTPSPVPSPPYRPLPSYHRLHI